MRDTNQENHNPAPRSDAQTGQNAAQPADQRAARRTVAADDLVLPPERPGSSRRSFLKLAGFGVAGVTLASCSRAPVRLVVPRSGPADATIAGRAYTIATTCAGCSARCGVLATCRDGRPVKLEGNPDHALSRGALCAVGQASLIELYDSRRTDGAHRSGAVVEWAAADAEVSTAITSAGAAVRILTGTVTSPSTRAWIERLVERTGGQHIEWDARSGSALLDAHEAGFGVRAAPHVQLAAAEVIVAFEADFLGTWGSPVEQARDWRVGRDPEADPPRMSRHVQFESALSLTGTKADTRHVVAPWELRGAMTGLCLAVATLAGKSVTLPQVDVPASLTKALDPLASELWAARGKSVVLCGNDDAGAQALAILVNDLLGNYGSTLLMELPALHTRGDDGALVRLIDDMQSGRVQVLIVHDTNPVYDVPDALGFGAALSRVGLVVSTSPEPDETATLAHLHLPVPHALEAWDDAEPVSGAFSVTQPTVPPLRGTRSLRGSLAAWLGEPANDDDLLRAYWRREVHPLAVTGASFDTWFDQVLHDGYVRVARPPARASLNAAAVAALVGSAPATQPPAADRLALVLHHNVGIPDGRHAHNPWLQELPDPLTKLTWDNVATLSPATAERLGLSNGDVVRLASPDGGAAVSVPVWTQLGQHPGVVALALGYGRAGTDRFSRIGPSWLEGRLTVREGETVGSRASGLIARIDDRLARTASAVELKRTGAQVDLACTQDHHRLEVPQHLAPPRGAVRDAVLGTTFAQWTKDPSHAIHGHELAAKGLWPDDHPHENERWGLAIDMSACIGCSGCAVACMAENNVPVVGKDEVRRHREMTWLRIDRYFSGGLGDDAHGGASQGDGHGNGDAAHPPGDLRVSHQPMMCQHCANAPCETVCPVLATVHSDDGLNQQVYNRCVGTRYCANNCPYKTRRFNWFDYPRGDELRNLALNPDVTVRSRGVMEKCSMCVQRIQEGRAESARRGQPIADGDIKTACQQSCPTDAIVFGDLNDRQSTVARLAGSQRAYAVLGELGVKPGVTYLAEIRNTVGDGRHE